jgi:hypothetical protein
MHRRTRLKTATLLVVTLCATATAYADFSYTTTRKAQGSPAAAAAPSTTKYYFKGQKMMTDSGAAATLIDFDAQTITNINKTQKTWSVMKFSELGDVMKSADIDAKVDVKETGQTKMINGFNASEMVMTMEIDSPQMAQTGMKMQMEVDTWRSSDVPGAQELKAFYQKNGASFPWAAMGGGGGAGMQKAMADLQRKMAASPGVPLLQIVKMKSAGGAQAAQMQAGMAQARAQMEAMIKQGGPQAAAAQQALARMGGAASGGGSLFETTMESSDFSTSSIPDSVFAIPAGFQKVDRK